MQIAAGINGNTNNNGQLTPLFVELYAKNDKENENRIHIHIAYSIRPCHKRTTKTLTTCNGAERF